MLYVLEKNANELYQIDPSTGAATLLEELDDIEVNGGDLVVNENFQVIYVHVDGEVWAIDLLGGFDEDSLGSLPGKNSYTGLALVDGVYYATENSGDALYSFDVNPTFTFIGSEAFDSHSVYSGDAASCPVDGEYSRNGLFGVKFYDNSAPIGQFDSEEGGLSEWTIRLYDDEWNLLKEEETSSDGEYGFNNLVEGTYHICEAHGDWTQTYPLETTDLYEENGSSASDEADGCYRVALSADEIVDGLNFGNSDADFPEDDGETIQISTGGFFGPTGGSVLGVSTGPTGSVLGVSTGGQCTPWLDGYIFDGTTAVADAELVLKLQIFLNSYQGESLALTGVYDEATADAVRRFQLEYRPAILNPWSLLTPTGNTWLTTTHWINELVNGCGGPLPQLQNFSEYTGSGNIFSDGFESGDTSAWHAQ